MFDKRWVPFRTAEDEVKRKRAMIRETEKNTKRGQKSNRVVILEFIVIVRVTKNTVWKMDVVWASSLVGAVQKAAFSPV